MPMYMHLSHHSGDVWFLLVLTENFDDLGLIGFNRQVQSCRALLVLDVFISPAVDEDF